MTNVLNSKNNTFKSAWYYFAFCMIILCTSNFSNAQESVAFKTGTLTFETESIDYNTIDQNSNGLRTFNFTNTGKAPVLISKVKTSCGCTVPNYPKTAILPGQTASIDVTYATNRIGRFTKSITVMSNASEPQKKLTIKGTVIKTNTL